MKKEITRARSLANTAWFVAVSAFCATGTIATRKATGSDRKGYAFARLWGRLLLAGCGVKVQVSGLKHLDTSEARIFMSNHLSAGDPAVLMGVLPVPVNPISKIELRRVPLMGAAMESIGFVFIDRKDRESAIRSISTMVEKLKAGNSALIFPEGTRRNPEESLQEFKKGGFHMALQSGCAIQPVIIIGMDRLMPPHARGIKPGTIEVRYGPAIRPRSGEGVDSLILRTREVMLKLLQAEEPGQVDILEIS